MGITASRPAKRTRVIGKVKLHRNRDKQTRDVVTQVGAIDFVDDELLFVVDKKPAPFFHRLIASTRSPGITAKEILPLSSSSTLINFQVGDYSNEWKSNKLKSPTLNLAGDCISERDNFNEKRIHPIVYQIRLKLLESSITRLLLVELYGLDMLSLTQDEFVRWAESVNLPTTAHMYEKFHDDANAYAIPPYLSELESRFKVRVTLGECIPLDRNTHEPMVPSQELQSRPFARELCIFGESPNRIASAVNYFGALLSQLRADQLLLPNERTFTISSDNDLKQWIVPRPPDIIDSMLFNFRRPVKP